VFQGVEVGLIRLLLAIDAAIYGFICNLFEIFIDLASSDVLSETVIESFVNRIYIIVGVIAIFMITYSLINSVMNPDDFLKGKFSGPKIFMNLVVSIVLIALVPTIFDFAFKVQDAILEEDIIGTLFLGKEDNTVISTINPDTKEIESYELTNEEVVKQRGSRLAWTVLNAFLFKNKNIPDVDLEGDWSPIWGVITGAAADVSWLACGSSVVAIVGGGLITYFSKGFGAKMGTSMIGGGVSNLWTCGAAIGLSATNQAVSSGGGRTTWYDLENFVRSGEFDVITAFAPIIANGAEDVRLCTRVEVIDGQQKCLAYEPGKNVHNAITYRFGISTVAGLFVLWMLLSFCLDLGVRAVKLAFYQMLAPIPILSRILPDNSKMFNNWVKVTLTTFMEVFIRLFILYSVLFFCSNLGEVNFGGNAESAMARCIIVLGIITFARQAPKLISEIIGIDSGNMKIGIMDKLNAGTFGFAGRTVGAATGFLGAGLASRAQGGGFFRGGLVGATNGWKARGNQFGKQKQSMYSKLGGKGKAGLFGKQSLGSKIMAENEKYIKGKVKSSAAKKVEAYEKTHSDMFASEVENARNTYLSKDVQYQSVVSSILDVDRELQYYTPEIMAARDSDRRKRDIEADKGIAACETELSRFRETEEYKSLAYSVYVDSYYDKSLTEAENKERYRQMRDRGELQKDMDAKFVSSDSKNAQRFKSYIEEYNKHQEAKTAVYNEAVAENTRRSELEAKKKGLEEERKTIEEKHVEDYVAAARKNIKDKYKSAMDSKYRGKKYDKPEGVRYNREFREYIDHMDASDAMDRKADDDKFKKQLKELMDKVKDKKEGE